MRTSRGERRVARRYIRRPHQDCHGLLFGWALMRSPSSILVRFTLQGQRHGDTHALVKGKQFIGLVADEAMRGPCPEMVTLSEGEIDGRKVRRPQDVRSDRNHLWCACKCREGAESRD